MSKHIGNTGLKKILSLISQNFIIKKNKVSKMKEGADSNYITASGLMQVKSEFIYFAFNVHAVKVEAWKNYYMGFIEDYPKYFNDPISFPGTIIAGSVGVFVVQINADGQVYLLSRSAASDVYIGFSSIVPT